MAVLKTEVTNLVLQIDKHLEEINTLLPRIGPAQYPINEAVKKLIEAKFWLMSSLDIVNRMEITDESNKKN